MTTRIVLKGEPKSTSHIYKSTCRGKFPSVYMSADGKALKESYQWQAKSQFKKKPLKSTLEVWAEIYFGTKRKSDVDNFSKIFLDSLTGIVWVDDSQIESLHISKRYDKKEPRIEVEVLVIE